MLKGLGFSWNEEKRIWERSGDAGAGAVAINVEEELGWKVGDKMLALRVDERGIIQERFVVWEECSGRERAIFLTSIRGGISGWMKWY
ncbi:hypothetical protein [Spirochaeta thermophila]|uniref:hypothetical protein n=1 Tax=Winmispira thermophila TaxID=154 RepID=UPI0011D12139|nr:hypothetical protein [Spirochaeta thermophila]